MNADEGKSDILMSLWKNVPTVPSIAMVEVRYYGFIYMRSVQKLQPINSKTELIRKH